MISVTDSCVICEADMHDGARCIHGSTTHGIHGSTTILLCVQIV